MKILKIIFFIFVVYFIRRFIQMYKVMKKIQEQQAQGKSFNQTKSGIGTIEADFKVVD